MRKDLNGPRVVFTTCGHSSALTAAWNESAAWFQLLARWPLSMSLSQACAAESAARMAPAVSTADWLARWEGRLAASSPIAYRKESRGLLSGFSWEVWRPHNGLRLSCGPGRPQLRATHSLSGGRRTPPASSAG